ncbi:MAG: hypothetical protein AAGA62_07015, partial [Bacteroidota bacterium]
MNYLTRPKIELARRYLSFLMLAGVIFGLVFSPPVLSIALISLVVLGLMDPLKGINPQWSQRIGKALKSPLFWGLSGLYLILILGVWQTVDWDYYLERLRIKTPLLALPLIWPGLPDFSKREYGWIVGGMVVFFSLLMVGIMVNYAFHFTEINDMIRRGQSMPVPRNHIRFSLLVAIATLLSVLAYRLHAFGKGRLWLILGSLLLLGQHFLAVRSGLAGAYGGIGILILALAWERGTWWPAVAG